MNQLYRADHTALNTAAIDFVSTRDAANALKDLRDIVLRMVVEEGVLFLDATKVQGTSFFVQLMVEGSAVRTPVATNLQSGDLVSAPVTEVVKDVQ